MLVTSLAVAAVVAILGWAAMPPGQRRAALICAMVLVPISSLSTLRQSALQGLEHVVAGRLPDDVLRPALFTVVVGGALALSVSLGVVDVLVIQT